MKQKQARGGAKLAPAVPLVLTKLRPPLLRRNALPRKHLISLLQQAIAHRLTLVCAGVGYGKTTFLAHALNGFEPPLVWYALNRSDRDIITFLSYLVEGIDRQWPGFAAALPPGVLSNPNRELELNEFMAGFINELVEIAGSDFLVVLDDFHLVEANPEVSQAVDYLVRHAPHRAHFVLSSRTAPSLPCLPRLRASGQVLELGEEALQFSTEDATALFRQSLNLELPPEVMAALVERAEGWVLGLLLIGEAIKGQGPDAAADIIAGLDRSPPSSRPRRRLPSQTAAQAGEMALRRWALFEYLTEEILNRQPPAIVDFMTSSAILSWLEPALCDATLGRSDSETVLRYLERHNLFVCRSADGWLRYHHLFRHFLYHYLAQDRERFETLHRRAATYYEEQGHLEKAIHHRLEGGDHARAAELLEGMSRELLRAGRFDTLTFWLDRLPSHLVEQSPKLLLCRGQLCERQGQWDRALARYEAAAKIYIARDDLVGLSDSLRHKGQILDWWRGEHAEAERLHQEALSYLGEGHIRKRAALLRNLSRSQLSAGNSEAALSLYREALQIYETEGDRQGELDTLINPGSWLYHGIGNFPRAVMALRRAERLAQELGNQRYLAEIYNNFSVNFYFLWRPPEAQSYADKALALSRDIGDRHNEAYALMNVANALEVTCGAPAGELYRQYQAVLRMEQAEGDHRFAIATLVFMSILLRHSGDLDEAVRRGRQALTLATERDLRWLTGFVRVNLGAAQIELDPEEARASLEEGLVIAAHCQDVYHQMAAHFWLASFHHHENNPAYLDHLGQCLRLAVGRTLDYFFQSEARAAIALLAAALEHNLWPSYVTQVLLKIGGRSARALQPLLSHHDSEISRRAAEILNRLNGHAADLRPVRGSFVPPLTFRCFGHFRVQRGETWLPEKAWRRRKTKRLLKYVVLSPHHTISKDIVIDRLWGDLDPAAANSNFYRTLYNARRVLEPQSPRSHSSYLVLKGGLLRLAEGVVQSVDLDDFTTDIEIARRALRQGDRITAQRRLEQATSLYTDDLFTDDLYDDWVQAQREHLRNLYLSALADLAGLALQASQHEQAAYYYRKILNLDPAREEFCLKLIDCLARLGYRAEALRHVAACEQALAELGVSPSPQLLSSKERLLA